MRVCAFPGCGLTTRYAVYCNGHHGQLRAGKSLLPLSPRLGRRRSLVCHPADATAFLVPLGGSGGWAIIDAADAAEVGKYNWTARKLTHGTYAYRRQHWAKSRVIFLHRFIAELAGMDMRNEIDHKNMNPCDNRRSNLRPATKSQQRCNQPADPRNTSGIKGVTWRKGAWVAQVALHGKNHYLGRFSSKDAAAEVVHAAREQLHGEFANHGDKELH